MAGRSNLASIDLVGRTRPRLVDHLDLGNREMPVRPGLMDERRFVRTTLTEQEAKETLARLHEFYEERATRRKFRLEEYETL